MDDGVLQLYLRTQPTSRGIADPVATVGVEPGWHHIALVFRPGEAVVYLDGRPATTVTRFGGDLYHWRDRTLRIAGREDGGDLAIEFRGLVLHRRPLTDEQVADSARRALRAVGGSTAESWQASAQVIASTPVPTLREISPYTEALVTRRYRLEDPPEGLPAEVVVVEWAILDGKKLPDPPTRRTLTLERFEDHRALEGLYLANDFEAKTLYYSPPQ